MSAAAYAAAQQAAIDARSGTDMSAAAYDAARRAALDAQSGSDMSEGGPSAFPD